MMYNTFLSAVLVLMTSTVEAHTWLENIMLLSGNGSMVGTPGYPRGYGPRTLVEDPDLANVYLLPPNGRSTGNAILPTDLMCFMYQTTSNYTVPGFNPLTAAPSDNIALRYLENGHVTKVTGVKPSGNGTVYVYGTTKPSSTDTYLGIHHVWNAAGTGGDKRGKLLATRSFDDGRCFQVNGQPISTARVNATKWTLQTDNICQTDVQIPSDAPTSGQYTMYWVWEWPTLDAVTGKVVTNESYTSCLDINMVSKSSVATEVNFEQPLTGDNVVNVGIPEQLNNHFLIDPSATPVLVAGPPFTMSSAAPAVGTFTSQVSSATTTLHKPAATSAGKGFVTVTVTESIKMVATVTVTANPGAAATKSVQSQAQSQASASVVFSSVTVIPSGVPKVSPFLVPSGGLKLVRLRGREVQV